MGIDRRAVGGMVLVSAPVSEDVWNKEVEPVAEPCVSHHGDIDREQSSKRQCLDDGDGSRIKANINYSKSSSSSTSISSSSSSSSNTSAASDDVVRFSSSDESEDDYEVKHLPNSSDLGVAAVDEMKRLRDRDAIEATHIEMLSVALWSLAQQNNNGTSNFLSVVKEVPIPNATASFKLPRSAGDLSVNLKSIVRSLNRYDIEMSDYNKFRDAQSLGFRTLLCSFVLVDRIFTRLPTFSLSEINVCRVTALCMMLNCKFSEDEPLNNKYWSQIAAVPLAEVNKCELALVKLFDYNFRVSEQQYETLLKRMGIKHT